MDEMMLRTLAENDQDSAACDEWWESASLESKLAVWNYLQSDFANPMLEVVSRFAALAFAQAAIRNAK